MNYSEINKELSELFPNLFQTADKADLSELAKMSFPKDFLKLYSKTSPTQDIIIGKFRLLSLKNLIDENLWEMPGEVLYEKGFSIVGYNDQDELLCLDMREKKKEVHELLLGPTNLDFASMNPKTIREKLKFIDASYESFISREFKFLRKSLKNKA